MIRPVAIVVLMDRRRALVRYGSPTKKQARRLLEALELAIRALGREELEAERARRAGRSS